MSIMQAHRSLRLLALALTVAVGASAFAGDLRLKINKRSKPTPVQQLNQDGVKAVEKHDYERARRLFYKAYLLDPNDPFTLNNLGFIAELDGEVERAQRYYQLAAEMPSDAVVDRAANGEGKGKEVAQVAGNAADSNMQVNRINVYAMGLLLKDRAPEADVALQKALHIDPNNPFTLNNLGWAKEKQGELEQALGFYSKSANTSSKEPVVVTVNSKWRGKSISEVSADNAEKVRKALGRGSDIESQVARLNLRGVSAINRNERKLARTYFEQAYRLDPKNGFTLNNMGYIAELDGDRETADFFYARAQEADRADARVAMSTRKEMEGLRLGVVASNNDQAVANAQQAELLARRQQGGPVLLKRRRDNSPVIDPDRPPPPPPSTSAAAPASTGGATGQANQPVQDLLPPLEEQPAATGQPAGNQNPGANAPVQEVIPPLPDNQQPQTQQPAGSQNPPGANSPVQDVIPPLPDNQQPQQAPPPTTQPPPTTPK